MFMLYLYVVACIRSMTTNINHNKHRVVYVYVPFRHPVIPRVSHFRPTGIKPRARCEGRGRRHARAPERDRHAYGCYNDTHTLSSPALYLTLQQRRFIK